MIPILSYSMGFVVLDYFRELYKKLLLLNRLSYRTYLKSLVTFTRREFNQIQTLNVVTKEPYNKDRGRTWIMNLLFIYPSSSTEQHILTSSFVTLT